MTVRITYLIAVMLLGVFPAPNPKVLKRFSPAFEYSVCLRLFSCLKSVTELLYYLGLLETLVFTCVIHSGLIESLLLGKRKNLQNVAAFKVLQANKPCAKAASEPSGKFGQRLIYLFKSHIPCKHVQLDCEVKCK